MSGDTEARVAEEVWTRRMTWLRRWLVVSWVALVASTWRLWTPQTVFPQVPFFGALRTVPGWVDWVALGGVAAGLGGWLIVAERERARDGRAGHPLTPGPSPQGEGGRRGRVERAFAPVLVGSVAGLVLLDQHRFQPWAYQFLIVAIVLAFAPAGRGASLLRVLTVGIYFWSAVSKFDYTFLHGLGPELLRGLLGAFQLEPRWMRPGVATALAWAFPIDELTVAVLLAIRRTRTIGLAAAIVMHVLLLATLGPFGLNHSPGVLLWNVYFIGQDLLLFRRPAAGWRGTAGPGVWGRFAEIARGVVPRRGAVGVADIAVYAAVWLPALEPFGWLDHWPGWAVYAPGGERVSVSIAQWSDPKGSRLPDELLPYFTLRTGPSFPSGSRFDLWSLDALSTPLYPGDRFSTGVAIAVLERYELESSAWLMVDSRADRFTGARSNRGYPAGQLAPDEPSQLRAYAESFRLNALPRKIGGW